MELQKIEPKQRRGLVVVITGNGKGKTTSAIGMTVRAAGHGMRSCVIHFMKGDMYSGEIDGLKLLGPLVEQHLTGKGFCGIRGNPYPHREHRANAQEALSIARERISSGDFGLVILDEINNALKLRLLDLPQVHEVLDLRPPLVHLVLTGRDAHPEIIARADTVSEVVEVKHAYREGIDPQPGIDY